MCDTIGKFEEGYIRLVERIISFRLKIQPVYEIIAWHQGRQQWYALFASYNKQEIEETFKALKQGNINFQPSYLYPSHLNEAPPNYTDVYVYLKGY